MVEVSYNLKMYLSIIMLFIVTAFIDDIPPQNPVIGIYTQAYNHAKNSSYISASYVK